LDITYIASALASCTTATDSRRLDDATIVCSTFIVAYDYQINIIQRWTDTTTYKENGLVSLVLVLV